MSQVITIFEKNGHSYSYDVRDAEDAERFENALDALRTAEKAIPKDGKLSEMIKAQCEMLKEFFDNCLGEGAGKNLCTTKDELGNEKSNNIAFHYEVYDEFLTFISMQKEDILTAKNTFAKYSNRQQRRMAGKK